MAEDQDKKDQGQVEEAAVEQKKPAEVVEKAEEQKKPAEAVEKAEEPKKPAVSDEVSEARAILGDGSAPATEAKPAARGRKAKSIVPVGIAHIKATFNNTMVSISDPKGGVVSWSSAGKAGFKGSRKSTAFAATLVAQDAGRQAMARGMREVEIRVQGAGSGRESAVRALQSVGLNVSVIKDITPVPHNGCRARKRRRV